MAAGEGEQGAAGELQSGDPGDTDAPAATPTLPTSSLPTPDLTPILATPNPTPTRPTPTRPTPSLATPTLATPTPPTLPTPTLPTPTLPAHASPIAPIAPAAAPSPPVPDIPHRQQPPHAPIGPIGPVGMTPAAIEAIHRVTIDQLHARRSTRKRASRSARILRGALLTLLVAIVATAAVFTVGGIRQSIRDQRLPTYAGVRPEYGTIVVEFDQRTDGSTASGTVTADAARTNYTVDWVADDVDGTWIHTPEHDWQTADGTWITSAEVPRIKQLVDALADPLIFGDFVPTEARPFAEVTGREDVELRGRSVERIDLAIAYERFRQAAPDAYEEWSQRYSVSDLRDDEEPGAVEVATLSVWVDDAGVVWRWSSEPEGMSFHAQYDIVSLDPAPFRAEPPPGA